MKRKSSRLAEKMIAQVPANWLDPLLSGSKAALKREPGYWDCQDIERLLAGLKARMQKVAELERKS